MIAVVCDHDKQNRGVRFLKVSNSTPLKAEIRLAEKGCVKLYFELGWVNPEQAAKPFSGYRKRSLRASASGATFFNPSFCMYSFLLGRIALSVRAVPNLFLIKCMPMSREAVIFLDESGDLGWKFGSPYRSGGSSRYLTIAAIVVPSEKRHLLARLIKKLYLKYDWSPKSEKKWVHMAPEQRAAFCIMAKELISQNNDIHYLSITVYKPKVDAHIREDANKLYNYMIGLLLIDRMADYDLVRFIPDYREIKVASGNSLHDYLVSKLWFEKQVSTRVINQPADSAADKGVQFADMLSGLIQHHFEDNHDALFPLIAKHIDIKRLFFP